MGTGSLAFKDGKEVRLVSRNQKDFNYPQLEEAKKKQAAENLSPKEPIPRPTYLK